MADVELFLCIVVFCLNLKFYENNLPVFINLAFYINVFYVNTLTFIQTKKHTYIYVHTQRPKFSTCPHSVGHPGTPGSPGHRGIGRSPVCSHSNHEVHTVSHWDHIHQYLVYKEQKLKRYWDIFTLLLKTVFNLEATVTCFSSTVFYCLKCNCKLLKNKVTDILKAFLCSLIFMFCLTITGWCVQVSSESTFTHTLIGSLCIDTLSMRRTEVWFIWTLIHI